MSDLMLHTGGKLCSYEELQGIATPPPQGRWHPVAHTHVLDTVVSTLNMAGYHIRGQKLAIARDGKRFFGTLDLETPLAQGVTLAVGLRNSIDKSFPLGFCAGNRVFVCDNLAFRAELLVKKKHTRYGAVHFNNAIAGAVQSLGSFKETEQARLAHLMVTELTDDQALAYMVRAMEQAIIPAPILPKVLHEWRQPVHDYGTGEKPTLWKLLNCFTTVVGKERAIRNPTGYAGQTIRLNALLSPPVTPAPLAPPAEVEYGQAA